MERLGCLVIVLVLVSAAFADAQSKKARKTLNLVLQVDGAGSGLDADRLQGNSPSDLVSQASQQATAAAVPQAVSQAVAQAVPQAVSQAVAQAVPQAVAQSANIVVSTLVSAYTRVATIVVSDGFCNTVDALCDANDFLLSCGGSVGLTTGYLTAVTEVPGAGGLCRAGGCGFGGTTSVAVSATCLPL